jgi:plasmid stabilization system protein ParE
VILAYSEAARDDLAEIIAFLKQQEPDRVHKFKQDFKKALKWIKSMPKSWPKVARGVRVKVLSKRFPFGIFYRPSKYRVLIGAVVHLARRSTLWKRRF